MDDEEEDGMLITKESVELGLFAAPELFRVVMGYRYRVRL